jgi:hypothetical protein
MGRRRGNHDPLATSAGPRWLKVQDGFRHEQSSTRIAPGTDLPGLMRREVARWVAAGWQVEADDDCRHGFFFMTRGGERWLVLLTARETPLDLPASAVAMDRGPSAPGAAPCPPGAARPPPPPPRGDDDGPVPPR